MNKLLKWATLTLATVMICFASVSPAYAAEAAEDAHAGEAPTLFESPNARTIITSLVTLLIFTGLLVALGKFAWGPIVAGLEKREGRIREDIEAAERARAAAEKAQLEYQSQLEGAEQRVRDLLAQAQADGQQLATRIKMQAQEEAEEAKERAVRDIETSRREAIEQIRAETAELATAIAEKILRREVNGDDQQRLVEESLNEFQAVGAAGGK
jgi:F-type H+-transporting ATPase subunit b